MRLEIFIFGIGGVCGLVIGLWLALSQQDVPLQRLQKEIDQCRAKTEICLFGAAQDDKPLGISGN